MVLQKKLASGANIRTWNYNEENYVGQAMGIKNDNGTYESVINVESAVCSEGTVNRVVIKKSLLEKMGWTIIEE